LSNSFQVYSGATAFIGAFQEALEQCHHSLYIQFSTFEGDSSGRALAGLLLHKKAQGVDVRLILDYYSDVVVSDVYPIFIHKRAQVAQEMAETQAVLDELRAAGIPIKRTAPPGFLGRFMLYRDHKKMILLDGQTAFVGGINVSDHNYAWHDFMVKMDGPLVATLTQDYLSTWEGQTIALSHSQAQGDWVVNQCAGRYAIFEEALRMIETAQQSLVIESPYLLGDTIEPAILRAAYRGVKVRLILPALSNKIAYRIWVKAMLRYLNHPNITLYGYEGEHQMTHAKLVLVDGRRASFGSCNFFELEGLTQKELNIFSDNPDLIRQLQDLIESDIADSTLLAIPSNGWGRFSYRWLHRFFHWWTGRLLQNPDWKARYC
jgi:cardiolipin synthase